MARKYFVIIFAVLNVFDNAYAQDRRIIGTRCTVEYTGNSGTCKLSTNCPKVEEQAKVGIRPTPCGTYHRTRPIVCCENSFIPEANDNTFLQNTESDSEFRPENSNSGSSFNSEDSNFNSGFISAGSNSHSGNSNHHQGGSSTTSGDYNSDSDGSKLNSGGSGFNTGGSGFNSGGSNINFGGSNFNSGNSNFRPSGSGSNVRPSGSGSNIRPSGSNSNSNSGHGSNSGSSSNFNHNSGSNSNTDDAVVYPSDSDSAVSFPSSSQKRISEQRCEEYNKRLTGTIQGIPLVTNTQPFTVNVQKCPYNGVPLIVGGEPAAAAEFPFMAAIGYYTDNEVEWKCGGTLISDRYILTAAHCTFSRDSPKIIRLGDLDLSKTDDGSVHQDYQIESLVVHPNYRYPLKYNDIALIKTNRKVKFTKYIRPACLYTHRNINEDIAVAIGWGRTDYAASETSSLLMKVPLEIFDRNVCKRTYPESKNLPQGVISSMMCAGHLPGGKDTCQGDSGGPLIITHKENQCKFFIVGVTSFGKGCGVKDIPAIYTKVSEYVSWIENMVW